MDLFTNIINEANYVLWTYVLVIMLLGCAIWFSVKTRFVQFRMLGEMIRLLGDSTAKINGHEKHISSFQAFAISLASRVGTGNLAGVATALTVGGPGAIFWMWIIALLGSSSAFVESTLAQLFKVKGKTFLCRRPCLLYGAWIEETLDGSTFCGTDYGHVWSCIQFGAK